jgi:hypothetical protein
VSSKLSVTSWALGQPLQFHKHVLASGCCCSQDAEPDSGTVLNLATDGSLAQKAWKLYPHECRRKPLAEVVVIQIKGKSFTIAPPYGFPLLRNQEPEQPRPWTNQGYVKARSAQQSITSTITRLRLHK